MEDKLCAGRAIFQPCPLRLKREGVDDFCFGRFTRSAGAWHRHASAMSTSRSETLTASRRTSTGWESVVVRLGEERHRVVRTSSRVAIVDLSHLLDSSQVVTDSLDISLKYFGGCPW